jgi:peptidoglycan/LPS O-acetylase OafA/YrhL
MADKTAPPEVFGLVHALRGVAATWVVLFHASEGRHIDQVRASLPEWLHPLFDLGDNGVAIFFALSGFVIAHSLRSDRITPSYLGRFALRRSIRLDPPLWASIVLVVALAALSAEVKDGAWAAPSLGQVITNATYTQLFVGYASLNVVYWTLCYEVQFYLVLVVSIAAAQRFGATVYIAMFLLAVLFGTGVAHTPISGLFIDLWHCFFLGVISYWAHRSRAAVLGVRPSMCSASGVRPVDLHVNLYGYGSGALLGPTV